MYRESEDKGIDAPPEVIKVRDFFNYVWSVIEKAWRVSWKWGLSQLLGLFIAVAILIIQIKLGVISSKNIRPSWFSILAPYGALFIGFFIYHLARAPWMLYREKCAEADAFRNAIRGAEIAGRLKSLAEDAEHISTRLEEILGDNGVDPNPIDMSRPFSRAVIYAGDSQLWQHRRMASLRDSYKYHRAKVLAMALVGVQSRVMEYDLPHDLEISDVRKMLNEHRKMLAEQAGILLAIHSGPGNRAPIAGTIST